jgi:ABC-2 type transport system permease protein
MINRIGLIAAREFVVSITNKGLLIGVLIMPALVTILAVLGPRILNSRSPQTRGEVAVMDPTGRVLPELRAALDPEKVAARRVEAARRAAEQVVPGAGAAVSSTAGASTVVAPIPELQLLERSAEADVSREKSWLLADPNRSSSERHLALIVVHPDAVVRATGKSDFGTYDMYVSAALDDGTEGAIFEGVRLALVNARMAASQLDPKAIEDTMRVRRPSSVLVGANGEQQTARGLTRLLPFVMGILLFMGVMIGGQTLMTSTVEEKSSHVVEVLLAAVSPLELMAGKLIGQLGVGLVIMGVYIGLGMLLLFQFAMFGLLDPLLVVYLLIFYLLSYLVFGALMSAIGAAVNQMADAQSLMGPILLLLVTPYILTPIIGRAPNSTFSVAVSFIPPINAFAMMARLASDAPPPFWQVGLTILVGLGAAAAAVWFAAKVFKIGLLMHGKPPNFATLVRWAREA